MAGRQRDSAAQLRLLSSGSAGAAAARADQLLALAAPEDTTSSNASHSNGPSLSPEVRAALLQLALQRSLAGARPRYDAAAAIARQLVLFAGSEEGRLAAAREVLGLAAGATPGALPDIELQWQASAANCGISLSFWQTKTCLLFMFVIISLVMKLLLSRHPQPMTECVAVCSLVIHPSNCLNRAGGDGLEPWRAPCKVRPLRRCAGAPGPGGRAGAALHSAGAAARADGGGGGRAAPLRQRRHHLKIK